VVCGIIGLVLGAVIVGVLGLFKGKKVEGAEAH
jgi:hypothetical protein